MQRWPWPVVLLLFCAGLVLAGCAREPRPSASAGGPSPAAPADSAPGAAAPAVPGAPGESESDPALETSLAPIHDVEVTARAEGVVTRLDVEEGDRVTEGARLAQIDDREARALLAERDAEVSRSQGAWERAQRLHEQKRVSAVAFIDARASSEAARAQRQRAALDVEYCAVQAPIAGMVMQRRVQRGQMVRKGDALFRISDPTLLRAELLLPEALLGSVRAGQPVMLVPVAGGPPTPARITRVSPQVDPASGTFRATIDLDNRHARLPAGVTVRVELGAAGAAGR
jgi:RND family efflux transporter MFP subunit